jgi:hypothetical protein
MVSALSLAFTWTGSAWSALAVDQNGDLRVPGASATGKLAMLQMVQSNDPCPVDGALARDSTGLALYCRSGTWRSFLDTRVTTQAYANSWYVGALTPTVNLDLDLSTLPGSRPLLLTTKATCWNSLGPYDSTALVELLDANGAVIGYEGSCRQEPGASTDYSVGVSHQVSLVKIAENAVTMRVYIIGGNQAGYDYAQLQLMIFNSE